MRAVIARRWRGWADGPAKCRRLGVIEGDFHWHKHDDQDEFFLVIEGELLIDLQEGDRTVTLGPNTSHSRSHAARSIARGQRGGPRSS